MASPVEAMRAIVSVRWPLLECYALARQDGLREPVGLVIDRSFVYGCELAQRLLVGEAASPSPTVSVTCLERTMLANMLAGPASDLAAMLRAAKDEPGRWIAVLIAEHGWMLSGTWQELMEAEAVPSKKPTRFSVS
jgi:hypothetical protein